MQRLFFIFELNPLTPLLFLKNFFLSLNEDRAFPVMIWNVVMASFESIFHALSKTWTSILMKIKWLGVTVLRLFGPFQDAFSHPSEPKG